MPTAILIGFEYKNDYLPGTIIDLYHCYKWCKSFNCVTKILTDIENVNEDILRDAIDNKLARKDLLKFYDSASPTIISNLTTLIAEIRNIINNIYDNRLIIYYTGHGVSYDNLVLPDDTLLSMNDLKKIILENTLSTTEIFIVLDCCNPNGIGLPFKLNGNMFELSTTDMSALDFIEHRILLITSSADHQKSVATHLGSLFTRYLFQMLIDMNSYDKSWIKKENIPLSVNRNLQRLTGNLICAIRKLHTGYQQNISIYSSYIIDPILWSWLGNNNDHDVVVDYTLNNIIVRQCPTIK
jgi:hypothetical protein